MLVLSKSLLMAPPRHVVYGAIIRTGRVPGTHCTLSTSSERGEPPWLQYIASELSK